MERVRNILVLLTVAITGIAVGYFGNYQDVTWKVSVNERLLLLEKKQEISRAKQTIIQKAYVDVRGEQVIIEEMKPPPNIPPSFPPPKNKLPTVAKAQAETWIDNFN